MLVEQIRLVVVIVALTLISGVGDSQDFVHAAGMRQDGRIAWRELARSALGFGVGIGAYWLAVRFLNQLGVLSPETQSLVWFGVTIVGVAAVGGRCLRWQPAEQVVAVGVLLGIGWLLLRTGSEPG